ncbi:MAG TPA: hypothetical protein VFN48_01165, partial [Solirubrobacteraceae bacterium]|nr:hypothetical protein [Solirubrobacteraceae bacterium]
MTPAEVEATAENLAARGRDELTARFREAYAKALGAHADLVSFDAERVEAMIQRSAAEADGLQWRRALAGVAARELDISLASALTHPAVVRAHQIIGAPSYESALAALAVPVPVPVPVPVVTQAPGETPVATPPAPPGPTADRAAETALEHAAEAELAMVMPESGHESEPAPAVRPAELA